ncbi:ABC transporter substrate-binding protein [Corallococcus llansteffanensis]|nr:helical backbone metal receptor [Corallococcus llansteffanensis]
MPIPESPLYLGAAPKAAVTRVVSLAPSLTQTVVALGGADRLVGVSRFDELPEVASLPRVGGFTDIAVEVVIGLKPDLVLTVASPMNRKSVETLSKLGIPVLSVPMRDMEDVVEAIQAIARPLKLGAKAEALVGEIARARARIREKAKARPHPRVLFVYGFTPLVVAGAGSFTDDLLRDVGAINVMGDESCPVNSYSPESAILAKPDVIIDGGGSTRGRESLQELPGLKNARWVTLSSAELLQPGPGLIRGLEELFSVLAADPARGR